MNLRNELEYILRRESADASEVAAEMMASALEERSAGVYGTDESLEALFALHLGLRRALFRLADEVERVEARLGPENGD